MAGQLWKPGFSPRSNSRALRLQGLEAPGGAADLLSSGQERPCCPGPSRPLPVPGEAGSWAVSRCPVIPVCAVGFVLPPRSPLRGAAARALRAAPGPAWRAAALRELGALSWGAVAVTVPGSRRASSPSWFLLPLPTSPFPPGKVGAAPAPPGRGSPVLGTLAPASAWLRAGPLSLGGLCSFISFSLSSYLDRSANSSHCSIPAGLSLNLRPNS